MWVLHKESEHKDNFKQAPSGKGKGKDKKKDTFNSDDGPSIQINKKLLDNAKSYLAALNSDFQQGGVSG